MSFVLSRSVYHAIARATAEARSHGYSQVTGAHLIAAILDDPTSVFARVPDSDTLAIRIRTCLTIEPISGPPLGTLPVGLTPDVRAAVLPRHPDDVVSTGHVALRLLVDPFSPTRRRLERMGLDVSELTGQIGTLVAAGELDDCMHLVDA